MELNHTIHGDALRVLKTLPDGLVDCVITSPPYYGLRDYGIDGQLGLESSLNEYFDKLLAITTELKRVLKNTGTMFWNHGDSYGTGSGAGERNGLQRTNRGTQNFENWKKSGKSKVAGYEKCLLLQAHRLAIRMVDEQDWILRNIIIWHKPNAMPSSVTDRFGVDYEPVFFFTKNKRYYFEQQFEKWGEDKRLAGLERARKYGYSGKGSYQDWYNNQRKKKDWVAGNKNLKEGMMASRGHSDMKPPLLHPIGRNKRSVWTVNTKPYKDAHFATFPEALIEPMILAGCPRGGVILDPFIGSGTTGKVAERLGRKWLGIELNPKYLEQIKKRTMQKALGI